MKTLKQKLLCSLALFFTGIAFVEAQQATITASITQQPCNDDGVITVTVTNMTPPIKYTYSERGIGWTSLTTTHSNVISLTDTYVGFKANNDWNYIFITATDINGIVANYTASNTSPLPGIQTAFNYSVTKTPIICPSTTGQLGVNNIIGGVAPYSYQIINGTTLQSYSTNPATVSFANQYEKFEIIVTDGNGCKVHHYDSLWKESPIALSYTGTNANCTNGTASVVASGGLAPYSYSWNNGATTQGISGLMQGYYRCDVIDAQGCSSVNSFSNAGYDIAQSVVFNTNSSVTNATCLQNDGSVLAFVSGGTAPYSFVWDNGATTQNISNLTGNRSYRAAITDANGCVGQLSTYVNATTPVNVTYNASPSSCTSSTGSATLSISGGQAPYTIVWNTYPAAATGSVIANLSSGDYPFTVTDANGCVRTGSAYIPPVSNIYAYGNDANIVCPATMGNVSVSVSGSNPPFTYAWSNGTTTSSLTNVAVGGYNCVITDAVGCSVTKSAFVNKVSLITVGFASTSASCIYASDGSAIANAAGGTAPYVYSWSNGQATNPATGLKTGNYYVTVTDANGCVNDYNNSLAFVGYNAANNSCYCTITGTVYTDSNNNCTKDAGENGIENIQIHASGLGYAYTNANGIYSFMAPTGTYTITESVQQLYPLTVCQGNNQVVTVTAASNCSTSVNFANTVVPIHDLHIITTSINQPVPGNTYQQKVIIQNEGTVTESNVQLGYVNDGQLTYNTCTPWALNQQNSTTYPNWFSINSGFPILSPGAASTSYIDYTVPTNVPMNTVVNFKDSVAHAAPISTVWLTDNTPWNNVDNHNTTVVSSYDPNFKEVTPKGDGPQGYILMSDSSLTYVVHFQNEGNYFAQNIVVVDSLDSDLNLATLRPGYSDHSYTVSVDENGVAKFKFQNINLPWKSTYGDFASSGMFTYSIKLKKNLPVGTQIKNTAAIYFDYNEPVITNTTINTLDTLVHTVLKEVKNINTDDVKLYPNPASTNFSLLVNANEKTESVLTIMDINGRIVSQGNVTLQIGENILQENTNSLLSGIYFVQLKTNDTVITKKLVVTK